MHYRYPYYSISRMLDEATATRKNGIIKVQMSGVLPTVCHEAKIIDKYPGGNIMYIMDPGTAQVFISIDFKDEFKGGYCVLMLGEPFWLETEILDSGHNEVTIFVNDRPFEKIKVQEIE